MREILVSNPSSPGSESRRGALSEGPTKWLDKRNYLGIIFVLAVQRKVSTIKTSKSERCVQSVMGTEGGRRRKGTKQN